MRIQTMPKETLAELLLFLADQEEFAAVEERLAGSLTAAQVRAALRELAMELKKEVSLEAGDDYDPQKDGKLSSEAKTIISYLSPGEEKKLLQAFGLREKTPSLIEK